MQPTHVPLVWLHAVPLHVQPHGPPEQPPEELELLGLLLLLDDDGLELEDDELGELELLELDGELLDELLLLDDGDELLLDELEELELLDGHAIAETTNELG